MNSDNAIKQFKEYCRQVDEKMLIELVEKVRKQEIENIIKMIDEVCNKEIIEGESHDDTIVNCRMCQLTNRLREELKSQLNSQEQEEITNTSYNNSEKNFNNQNPDSRKGIISLIQSYRDIACHKNPNADMIKTICNEIIEKIENSPDAETSKEQINMLHDNRESAVMPSGLHDKMNKEEKLSDFIIDGDGKYFEHITAFRVKEAIRKLKEEIKRGVDRNKVFPLDWCMNSIDEIFGERLVKNG